MISFFDIHSHYTDIRYKEMGVDAEALLFDALTGGTPRVITSGTDPASSRAAIRLAKKFPGVSASVGIHPTDCFFIEDMDYALAEIESLIVHRTAYIAAVGEIGLDYYHKDRLDKTKQKMFFERQLSLSEKYKLPAIIHCRDAIGDCVEILRRHPKAYGAMHCFSGSPEIAKELVKMGWYISIAGNLTYPRSEKLREVVKAVGIDHLLIETDAPYMTPCQIRGLINNSSYMRETAEGIADVLEMKLKDVSAATFKNASRLFKPAKYSVLGKRIRPSKRRS